jgi:hypothetical protein
MRSLARWFAYAYTLTQAVQADALIAHSGHIAGATAKSLRTRAKRQIELTTDDSI